ncbi:MAG TPA: hypothetical protein VMF08_20570 [Candidatus Sulfotelmatobacter sp.]|nr:hypothetical protein [Candidatus Sulfotelmatobacter sp.]
MSSIRNTVVVALMQVGVIVAAVLAAGVCHKVWTTREWAVPSPVALLYNHGVAGLLIPLAWVTGAAVLQTRSSVSEDARVLMFWLGVLVLIALIIFAAYADISPWLVFLRNAGNGEGDDAGA